MTDNAPIIFIHYGNNPYLKYVFKTAKTTNPNKKIILLGDNSNKELAIKNGVEHYDFKDYDRGEQLNIFEKSYKFIAGTTHGRENWTKFVFKRWYIMRVFLKTHNINSFWTFDSDNLILCNLEDLEPVLNNFDCTEQCKGNCMNGYISNFNVVDGYIKKMNELFNREEYISHQIDNLSKHPDFAYTEMRAYATYKKEEGIKSKRLSIIEKNKVFDDAVCIPENMEAYNKKLGGYNLKKIYFANNGEVYCIEKKTGEYIKMMNLNLSWVPLYIFEDICKHVTRAPRIKTIKLYNIHNEPFIYKLRNNIARIKTFISH